MMTIATGLVAVRLRWAGQNAVTAALAATLGVFSTTACHHAPTAGAEGESSFAFVYTPAAPEPPKTGPSSGLPKPADMIVQAEPIMPLATPVYPKAAAIGHADKAIVGVRITVDTDGRVSEVGPSLLCFSTPSPFSAAFQAAVEAAVAQWHFHPGKIRHFELVTVPDGTSYPRVASTEKVEWKFDVSFTFTASGNVLSGFSR